MDLHWLRRLLPQDLPGDLEAHWRRFAETTPDPNPHGFVLFLFHEGLIDGRTARRVLVSGDVALSLGRPATRGHERLGVIGRGAMGEVIVARDSVLRRAVALKRHVGQAGQGQFLAEAQITAQLDHPGVVPVYGFDGSGELGYSMKLIRGGNLCDYLDRARRFHDAGEAPDVAHALEARLELFLRVCDAVAYAHDSGVVHRDLKPENIMVGDFHEVLVADWGIAHLIGPEDPQPSPESIAARSTAERSCRILGTPLYMSPEQASGSAHVLRPATDQYSLGLILYELVTLCRANQADEPREVILRASRAEKAPMVHHDASVAVHPALEAIVDRATRPWPDDRYPGVQELAADVRRFLLGEEVHAWPDTPLRATWRRLQRHPVGVMAGLLALVLGAALLTTGSLLQALQTERQAQEQRQTIAGLLGEVTRQGQVLDRQLVEVELLLEGLAVAVASRLQLPPGDVDADPYRPADLGTPTGPPDAARSARYDQVVSFDSPVFVVPPDVPPASLLDSRQRLGDIDDVMKSLLLRSAGADPGALEPEERAALLRAEAQLMWAYLQLEDGLMINYPGNANYPEDYDGRRRPWYRDVVGTLGPRWGRLYPDATGTGYLLPCNQAIYGADGRFLGVAGLDLSMDQVIATIGVSGIEGLEHSLLVDREGRVLLSTLEEGLDSEVSIQGHRTKERAPIGVPELEEAARAGAPSGFVQQGGDLYVFAGLKNVPWMLVARIDAAAHGFD